MTVPEDLLKEIESLPPEALQELRAFVAELHSRFARPAPPPRTLSGLWEDYGPVTDEDIAQWRKEMWGNFGNIEL